MMKLSSPMRVEPPPLAVPTWIVTCSRSTLSAPITSSVASSEKLLSCGSSPSTAKGKTRVRAPMRVRPVSSACGRTSTPGAQHDLGPDHGVGADADVVGELGAGIDERGRMDDGH